ncbi:phage major capsid protein [Granulicella sp. dw_53]|uniref:phage major capsid protein n=1 Tax=Granulicella sp. dw_53 TaxID=2719792 RepID=UPI001BD6A1EA|nr:phage major capsid protein [Granulicella sp. dw_53]
MNLKDMQEQRTKLISDAQKIVLQDSVTTEQRAEAEAMLVDVDKLEADINLVQKLEKLEAETRATTRPSRPTPGAVASDREERDGLAAKAFEKYIRYGASELTHEDRSALREKRDLTTTNAAYTIPQQFLGTLIDAQKMVGNTVSIVGKKVTNNNGAPIKVSFSNDVGNTLTTMTGENTVVTESDPSFSGLIMQTDTLATMVKVSIQELEDSYFDLNSWLRDKFALRYYRGLETLITAGNGSNIASIVAGATLGATTVAANGPTFDDFTAIYGALDPAYENSASWVMSSTTRAYIMGLKDTLNRPLFIPNPSSGVLDTILGRPVVLNQALSVATTAAATGILYGDFSQGYLLRTDGDLAIRRLDERFADALEVGFLAYARVGGVSTDAGTHPILKLVTHA